MNTLRTLTLFAIVLISAGFVSAQASSGSWLKGTWSGTGYQIDNNETWTMQLKATGSKYAIDYPSLKCGGVWRLITMGGTVATFRESITRGKEQCTNGGKVTIERLNDHQIDFRYTDPGKSEIIASAILKKLKS